MDRVNSSNAIQDIRFASLLERPLECKELLPFSSLEKALILTQAARYPWMQRTIAEERNLLNDLSIEKIKEISQWLKVVASNPVMERQLLCFLPSENRTQFNELERGPVFKPSQSVIKAQAELFRASREGKIYAHFRHHLWLMPNCSNRVFSLKMSDGSLRKVAFFKQGMCSHLEQMIWDISVLLGWEDLFTPTKVDYLFIKRVRISKNRKTLQQVVNAHVKGSMQPAIRGISLHSLPVNARINGSSLRRAFVAMYLLGLRDLHENNLFIVSGRIKMFDNTFCLPPDNRWIIVQNDILPVHRFAPLNLTMSKIPLTSSEVDEMRQMMQQMRDQWSHLNRYFDLRKIDYPRYWFDRKKIFKALEVRLERLENGLNEATGKSLCELMEDLYPEYKFVAILTYIYFLESKDGVTQKEEEHFHSYIGGYYMISILRKLLFYSYDFQVIQKKAEEPGMHLAELIEWVKANPQIIKRKTESEVQIAKYYLDTVYWLDKQFSGISYDLKGFTNDDLPLDRYGVITKIYSNYLLKKGFDRAEGTFSQMNLKIQMGLKRPCDYYAIDKYRRYLLFTDGLYTLI